VLQRLEIQRRRPGIVHQHARAFLVRNRRYGRDVLHLEALRTGRFGEHGARIRLEQFCNVFAERRIVIGRFNAHALEHAVAERARRPVGAVGDQDVIAGARHRHQRGRDRREAGGQEGDARASLAFDRGERLLQGFGRGRAAAAVLISRAMRGQIFRRRIEHGRGVVNGRVDEAVMLLRMAPGMHQSGVGLLRVFGRSRHS
jgi:hypothetical protein